MYECKQVVWSLSTAMTQSQKLGTFETAMDYWTEVSKFHSSYIRALSSIVSCQRLVKVANWSRYLVGVCLIAVKT